MNLCPKTAILSLVIALGLTSCKKEDPAPAHASVNNTNWKVDITITGNSSTQNVFEFANDGAYFSWHPAAAPSYKGTWTQQDATVNFTFTESTPAGTYEWTNTGTLGNGDSVLTGSMQRTGAQGSGTFRAVRL